MGPSYNPVLSTTLHFFVFYASKTVKVIARALICNTDQSLCFINVKRTGRPSGVNVMKFDVDRAPLIGTNYVCHFGDVGGIPVSLN